jgi:hypothetical protein
MKGQVGAKGRRSRMWQREKERSKDVEEHHKLYVQPTKYMGLKF